MHSNTSEYYDVIVVGAGIAGCCAAYALQQKGQRVLLVDRSAVPASGGSGAAGAFVSPKIGKGSPLQSLTNEAFDYAKAFYLSHFPEYFHQTGIVRLPKNREDAEKFVSYEEYNIEKYQKWDTSSLAELGIQTEYSAFFFEEAGVCDAPEMCRAIWEEVAFRQFEVASIEKEGKQWRLTAPVATDKETEAVSSVQSLYAKDIVLATGYQNTLFDMRYMGVRGTWGSRGDYLSDLALRVSMHRKISISANINGVIKLGATHVKHDNPCMVCDGKPLSGLEAEAATMIDSSDLTLKEIFCGMRAGSKDYFPLVGKVIDVAHMTEAHPGIFKGAKPPLQHIDNLYILNGVGGRGFVFAPLMAQWLTALMLEDREVDSRVNPDRLFLKWARKAKSLATALS